MFRFPLVCVCSKKNKNKNTVDLLCSDVISSALPSLHRPSLDQPGTAGALQHTSPPVCSHYCISAAAALMTTSNSLLFHQTYFLSQQRISPTDKALTCSWQTMNCRLSTRSCHSFLGTCLSCLSENNGCHYLRVFFVSPLRFDLQRHVSVGPMNTQPYNNNDDERKVTCTGVKSYSKVSR